MGRPARFRPTRLLLVTVTLLTAEGQIPRASNQLGESSSGPRVESCMRIELMEQLEGQEGKVLRAKRLEERRSSRQQVSV